MPSKTVGSVQQVLQEVWGYDSFRPLQEPSIQSVLDRRDSLTVLPTGGGKSLCFQVPAICMDGLAVVVSPLISLMKDQVDALQACGVAAAFVNSSQSEHEKREVATLIRQQKLKLLYVAPERLLTPRMLDFLRQNPVSFFAIDEAHCISNWGHDFRPEYRGLKILREHFPGVGVHAYTATASERVREDIVTQLGLQQAEVLVGNFDRPNLVYRMFRSNNRLQQVMEIIARHRGESGIVYCISRKEVARTAQVLNQMGCSALPYHAGLDDAQRKANQDAFIKERCDIIVATVAFGMGIDKSNVRYAIHAGMPKSIEHYQQESGRAGRDGLESECVLIYSGSDVVTWKKILQGDNQEAFAGAVKSLDAMSDLCTSPVCRHQALVQYFGQAFDRDNCGACDVCLDELDLVEDPITISQKILSCVLRLHERYGSAHTTKVLTGSEEQRIRELGHNQLSTFGLLAADGVDAVRMWIEQLVAQGFLVRSGEYQVLSLSESGRALLKRIGNPRLTLPPNAKRASKTPVGADSWEGVDRGLFDALRTLRSELASARNVPAYVVFGDSTLRELARQRPTTNQQFTRIRGVGEKKQADFGETFMQVIRQYCQENGVETNVDVKPTAAPVATTTIPKPSSFVAFEHFRRGESLEYVAKQLGRATSTVAGYLQDYLRHERITDCTPWVDAATRDLIVSQLDRFEGNRLTPIFEHFEGKISYDTLRIAITCHKISGETPLPKETP